MSRRVLVLVHPSRPEASQAAALVSAELRRHGLQPLSEADIDTGEIELTIVLGGDGTILRAAEVTRGRQTPLVGVNLGHIGFLAESEVEQAVDVARRAAERDYQVEERMTLDVTVTRPDGVTEHSWAINEASVEKDDRARMIEVAIGIDGRGLSTFGCDGVVLATPTGSTAYAFSAGGPVVWPEVEAMLMVPISAHALFARPLVVSPDSTMAVEVLARSYSGAEVWCDGRRQLSAPPGSHIQVEKGQEPVRLARLHTAPFTDRLVQKFDLPVSGWRGGSA
ncbi:MAG: NAD kinase [Beutenbergiaceae bacterium]